MLHVKKIAMAAAMATGLTGQAFAQDTTLRVSTWVPPQHFINTVMFENLNGMIEEASGGTVTTELVSGLAPPPAAMDLILDGAADITIIFHGYQPGRFVGTQLIELPGYEGNAEAASVAYWRVYEEHLAALDEHRGVKVIALHTHGPGQMHTSEPVSTLADLDGLKTRIGGGVGGNIGAALGLVGINVPAPRVYETLESGAADAVAIDMSSRVGFKLDEVAPYVYEMPGGFYRGSFAFIMSQETFDSLPSEVQSALDEQVFGETLSRMAGAAWDAADVGGFGKIADGNLTVASDEDQAAFADLSKSVIDTVMDEVAEAGVDAEAARAMIAEQMAQASAE